VASQALTNFAYMGGFMIVPQLLEVGLGFSTSHIGWLIIARPLVFSLVAPFSGRIAIRIGERNAGVIGAIAVMCSMLMLSQINLGSSDLTTVAPHSPHRDQQHQLNLPATQSTPATQFRDQHQTTIIRQR